MTEKEQQFNQWFDEYANGVKIFEEADMKQAYLQGRAELEKENAELKSLKDVATLIRANNDTVVTLMQLNNMLVGKNQQLTKAKTYLKYFIEILKKLRANKEPLVIEAEQFLKEVEK